VLRLHQHQREAVETARKGGSYALTTGTGSGRRLAYIIPIVDRALAATAAGSYRPGIKAIVVHPMNALTNSQLPGAGEVPESRFPGRASGHVRPLHRPGITKRPGEDHSEPARHPADQLRDARAGADEA
jgi:DEAD/DEAH box helicase